MVFARRTAALRITAMAALAASAVLISDGFHPDRAFCPLEQACEAARASALGTLFGVPTSVLGACAFGGLFFLTLLPVEWGRRLLQFSGFLAAVAGVGFIVYQAMVLRTFCPLCLVADGAGLLAGLITLTWPPPPIRVSGRRLHGEGGTSRLAWTLAGVLAVAIPFAMPRPEEPSWVEVPEQALLNFDDEEIVEAAEVTESGVGADAAPPADPPVGSAPIAADLVPAADPHPSAIVSTTRWRTPEEPIAAEPAAPAHPDRPVTPAAAEGPHAPHPTTSPARQPGAAAGRTPAGATPAVTAATGTPGTAPGTDTASRAAPAASGTSPRPRRKKGPIIVEYLNAYCGHCRATHYRLEKVLKEMGVSIRRRRVYAWASQDYPLWVRACTYAKEQGAEGRLFAELMRTQQQTPAAIYGAARRAGLDVIALQCAIEDPDVPAELVRDCKRMKSAGLKGLPTLDIGRRRLMGEQSEEELRAAIRAALAEAGEP